MKSENAKEFKPFIPADKILPELTLLSVAIGIFVAVLFGAANAYLGLKIGMTISASIPSAVISMGIIRGILHRDSILENNMVQTIGSAGVSIASASIFVIPALFMCADEWGTPYPDIFQLFCISLIGGFLGIVFMVPLRKALIVKEHETLPYPEGKACAEVLLAGEKGGLSAKPVFLGLGVAAGSKFISDGMGLYPSTLHLETNRLGLPGGGFGVNILPALIGVGYICGFKISSTLLGGSVLGWLVIMPLIAFFGGDAIIYPGKDPISSMSSTDLWSNYIRYIGAGAVATGGVISLIKSMPLIVETFRKSFKNLGDKGTQLRTDRDVSIVSMIVVVVTMFVLILVMPNIQVNFIGAILVLIFGFLFSTVASRVVGIVGVSNNPISGMVIASVLIIATVLKQTGLTGREGIISTITVAAIVCTIISLAGDTSQDLKTGYIVGATPRLQQIGITIGVIGSAAIIGLTLYLFNSAWGYGNINMPAPQASLIKIVIEGIMSGNLPWGLFIAGGFIAVVAELLKLSTLSLAVGLYLPIEVNATIFIGGLISLAFEKIKSKKIDKSKTILYSSGFIAGEGIIGVLLAAFAIIPAGGGKMLDEVINISEVFNFGTIGAIVALGLIVFSVVWFSRTKVNQHEEAK